MENFLLKLLNMSLTGSYVILAVLVLRLLLRAAPRWVSYALWTVPFLRLALPFSFESAFSLVRVRPNAIPADIAYAVQPAIDSGVRPLDTVVNAALTATAPDVTAGSSVNPLQVLLFVCFWLWLAGVICLAVSSLVQTVRLRRYLRTARHIGENLYEIGRADTPFVFGFLKPRIYLPAGLNGAEYDYILAHERHHIKRFDHILRPLAFCVTAAHWFNPLVWLAYRLLGADMEQSCDEAVLRRFGADIRKSYSASLVGLAAVPRARRLGPLGFAENDITRRVKHILRWKRPHIALTALAVCVLAVAGCQLMTNPADDSSASTTQPAQSNAPDTPYNDPISEYAFMYMSQVETMLEKHIEIKHCGYGLQEHAVFNDLLDEPITVYQLDVYYVPEDYEAAYEALSKTPIEANFVKNGDQYELTDMIDGAWVKDGDEYILADASNYSHIYFAILSDGSSIQFDRLQYDGSDPAKLETLLRAYLERSLLLDPPTFDSKHYIITYEHIYPGLYGKLFLSQPARQGTGGIWCVERYMDENSDIHLATDERLHPLTQTGMPMQEYFSELQAECDNGHNPWLLDPEEVAREFIRADNTYCRLLEMEEGSYQDFQEWLVCDLDGYVLAVDDDHIRVYPGDLYKDAQIRETHVRGTMPLEYYNDIPYTGNTVWRIDGREVEKEEFLALLPIPVDHPYDGVFAKCTYYGGQLTEIHALTQY